MRQAKTKEGRSTGKRVKVPAAIEARLLIESRRRCCLCVFLNKDWGEKQVQIAHISGDREDSSYENLVVLCLNHHDRYDSRPSQSKGIRCEEISFWKEKLTQSMEKFENGPSQFYPSVFAPTRAEDALVPAERLKLRVATKAGKVAITRILANIGQFGAVDLFGDEWELRAERLGGRAFLVGLLSQSQGNWLTWVAHTAQINLAKVETTLEILGQFHNRPEVKVIPHRDSYGLLVRRLTFHGTGAERHSEIWYVRRGKELVEILDYPTYAYVSGWCSFQREIRAITLKRPEALNHGADLKVLFQADYSTDRGDACGNEVIHLFSEERLFHATWDADIELFLPAPTSQLGTADVEALFNAGDEEFFHSHRAIIKKLLRSKTKERRLWAENIVTRYGDEESRYPKASCPARGDGM